MIPQYINANAINYMNHMLRSFADLLDIGYIYDPHAIELSDYALFKMLLYGPHILL